MWEKGKAGNVEGNKGNLTVRVAGLAYLNVHMKMCWLVCYHLSQLLTPTTLQSYRTRNLCSREFSQFNYVRVRLCPLFSIANGHILASCSVMSVREQSRQTPQVCACRFDWRHKESPRIVSPISRHKKYSNSNWCRL